MGKNIMYCDMVMVETPQLEMRWLCSNCEAEFKMSKLFEESKICPNCSAIIDEWHKDELDDWEYY